jgi:hypothetical protein
MGFTDILLEENVGGIDLFIRALIGTAATIALAMDLVTHPWKWLVALIALIGLFTAITRHCTAYIPFKFSTAKK